MEHLWTIPCQVSTVDQETNGLTLVQILENIQLQVPDFEPDRKEIVQLIMPMHVVTMWQRSQAETEETGEARVTFVSPSGAVLVDQAYEVPLVTSVRYRYTIRFPSIPFDIPGTYSFNIYRKTPNGQMRKISETQLPISVVLAGSPDADSSVLGNGLPES